MSLRACLFASLMVFAAAGCGGEGGAGPVDQSTAADGCQATCDRDAECGSSDADCVMECVDSVVGVFREDVFLDAVDCIVALECGASDDVCLTQCEPTSTHLAYEERCRDELGACGADPNDLDQICEVTPDPDAVDDDTGVFCIFATTIIEDMIACFDEPDCNAQFTCLQAVAEGIGI